MTMPKSPIDPLPAGATSPCPSPPTSSAATATSPSIDDHLGRDTMHSLLKPADNCGPALSWTARQAREQRRRNMLQLHRWVEVESERLLRSNEMTSSTPLSSAALLTELSTTLRGNYAICDQAVDIVVKHLAGGTASAGDDLAAQVLVQIWDVAKSLSKQLQQSLESRVHSVHQEAEKLKKQLERVTEELKAKETALAAVENKDTVNRQMEVAGKLDGPDDNNDVNINELLPGSSRLARYREITAATELAMEKLKTENQILKTNYAKIKQGLETATVRIMEREDRIDTLERVAFQVKNAWARAERAEKAAQEAEQRLGAMTPRPRPEFPELLSLVSGDEGKLTIVLEALKTYDTIEVEELAKILVHVPAPAPVDAHGPTATVEEEQQNQPVTLAPTSTSCSSSLVPLKEEMEEEEEKLMDTTTSLPTVDSSRFAGLLVNTPLEPLIEALALIRGSTSHRYNLLEARAAALKLQNIALGAELEAHREAEKKREAARRRREEETQLEKKNAIQQYLDLLASQGEESWKDQLIGMGQGIEVPKIFSYAGKIRNKHLSKRDTEKLVKEIWKERMQDPAVVAGRAGEIVDFVGSFLQKKVGIAAAVIELGYNFLYGLWIYQWDADCELFLKILTGETREDVYIAQVRLQMDLEELFAALDKAKGAISGFVPKDDLRTALHHFFRVGQPGGKTTIRFDEVMQALEQDQPQPLVEWKKVFEEDREFNQGEFAECLRDQFLQERIEYFQALETALYEESGNEDNCTKDQVIRAVLTADPECSERAAQMAANGAFSLGVESLSVKAVIKKLSRGMLRGVQPLEVQRGSGSGVGRNSSAAKMSVMVGAAGRGRGSKDVPGGAAMAAPKQQNEAIGRALEAVRLEWIQKQLKGGGG